MDIAVNDLTAARNAVKSDDFIAAVELPSGVSASAVSSQAVDCLGVTGGTAVEDVCGICDGDGTSCLDCMGVPNGNAVLDQCDVCNGDGSSCIYVSYGDPYTICTDITDRGHFPSTLEECWDLARQDKMRFAGWTSDGNLCFHSENCASLRTATGWNWQTYEASGFVPILGSHTLCTETTGLGYFSSTYDECFKGALEANAKFAGWTDIGNQCYYSEDCASIKT